MVIRIQLANLYTFYITYFVNTCLANKVADLQLAQNGKSSCEWACSHTEILEKIGIKNERSKPLAGYRLGFCLHITKETSVLVMTAKQLGADIALCSANPLSVQDDIAAFRSSEGVNTYAWRGETVKEYKKCIQSVLEFKPDIVTDDGADLHVCAHKIEVKNIRGGTEENQQNN
jgi:adenosylhomocysteinase